MKGIRPRSLAFIFLLLVSAAVLSSCASTPEGTADPGVAVEEAKNHIHYRRYQDAIDSLETVRVATVGTALGGEVQYLLGKAYFLKGKYLEADSIYSSYLLGYPGGAYAEEVLFQRALANVKQVERTAYWSLSFSKYIPDDRDISSIRNARILFTEYLSRYPEGERAAEAREWGVLLLEKEGYHEVAVASFYLRKKRPDAALARARAVMDGDYPPQVKEKAQRVIDKALVKKGKSTSDKGADNGE